MEDRGEKIVFLARELLESNIHELPTKSKKINLTITFKTLCFTTLLAAAIGNLISTYVLEQTRPLNRYEKVELQALVFYAAKMNSLNEESLRQEVQKQVGVKRFDDITAKEFSVARHYLQDKAQ